jgi:hypothetical protein
MLATCVITIPVALVQFNALATIQGGAGHDRVRRRRRADDARGHVVRSAPDVGRDGESSWPDRPIDRIRLIFPRP